MQISNFIGHAALLRYSFKRQCGGGTLIGKSCLILATPCSSVNGISQARILEQVAFSSPGDLPNPGIEHTSPTLQAVSSIIGGFFTSESPGKPLTENTSIFKNNKLTENLGYQTMYKICNNWKKKKTKKEKNVSKHECTCLDCIYLSTSEKVTLDTYEENWIARERGGTEIFHCIFICSF